MKQIITATNDMPHEFFIKGEYAFALCGDDGGELYDWTQCSDILSNGDVLEFTHNEAIYRVYMYQAWPTQIAGPRLKALHSFRDTGWITDPEHLKVAPDNIVDLVEPKYLFPDDQEDDNE